MAKNFKETNDAVSQIPKITALKYFYCLKI